MKDILFFDTDEDLKRFATNCQIKGVRYIFFDEPFYQVKEQKLKKFSEKAHTKITTNHSERKGRYS